MMSRSWLVQALGLVAAVAIGSNVVNCDNLDAAGASVKTTLAPIATKTTARVAVATVTSPASIVASSVTTIKPSPQINAAPKQEAKPVLKETVASVTAAPVTELAVVHLSTAKPLNAAVGSSPSAVSKAMAPADRVREYFEPVCSQLDRLQPKQMFKIQSQLKQFVEKTAGKMSLCFMQTYSMNPNLTPVNKAQLQTICGSRSLDPAAKGSFKSFLDCAGHHYDPILDSELARIQKSRASSGPNHDHSSDNLASLPHDDDELSLISEVVNKVIADSKISSNKTDVKILDLNADSAPISSVLKTTAIPVAAVSEPTTAIPVVRVTMNTQAPSLADKLNPSSAPTKKVLEGSNTKVASVKDVVSDTTTKPPQKAAPVSQTTVAPKHVSDATVIPVKSIATAAAPKQATSTTTAKPVEIKIVVTTPATAKATSLGEKIVVASGAKTTAAPITSQKAKTVIVVTDGPRAASTPAPVTGGVKTTSAAPLKVIAAAAAAASTGKPSAETTKKPEEGGSTTAPQASTSGSKTTVKPQKKVVGVLKKQDQEKGSLDSKIKKERVQVIEGAEKKKDDDLDAKKAIKSLQAQRAQAHGSPADMRMHQIEHERQMSIDPVGHTIKHQEYEKKKAAVTTAKAASTTEKPR